MSPIYHEIEERVEQALDDLQTQNRPNIRATARKFGVPRMRLARRFHRTHMSKIEAGGQNKALDSEAERALCLYIDFAEQINMPLTTSES